jgi:hypothetical protein
VRSPETIPVTASLNVTATAGSVVIALKRNGD